MFEGFKQFCGPCCFWEIASEKFSFAWKLSADSSFNLSFVMQMTRPWYSTGMFLIKRVSLPFMTWNLSRKTLAFISCTTDIQHKRWKFGGMLPIYSMGTYYMINPNQNRSYTSLKVALLWNFDNFYAYISVHSFIIIWYKFRNIIGISFKSSINGKNV